MPKPSQCSRNITASTDQSPSNIASQSQRRKSDGKSQPRNSKSRIETGIQNPAAQAEVCLVLIGHKGTGKGTLAKLLRRIFGAHAFQVTSREHVIGRFNGHLQDCVLFIADEAYWGGDKRPVGTLQGMITEETLAIENKGYNLITVPNYLHVLMLAEPGWVIPAGRYERRYAALRVSEAQMRKGEYFKPLYAQIFGTGAAGMLWDFQRMDLGDWHPREIPDSLLKGSALQHQQTLTLPPMEQWYLSLLEDGEIPGALIADALSGKRSRPQHVYAHSLMAHAKNFHTRLKYELTYNQLQMFLEDAGWPKATKWRDKHSNGYIFFPLQESRAAWDKCYSPRKYNNLKDWRDLLPGETAHERLSKRRLFEMS
jgi:energy-coupling factor transporter ATP-binding protein EcfA2